MLEVRRGPRPPPPKMEDRTMNVMLLPARATKTVYFVRHGEVRRRADAARAGAVAADPGVRRAGTTSPAP